MSLYEDVKATGGYIDNHASDLYIEVNDVNAALLAKHKLTATIFINEVSGKLCYDVPFAYEPFWKSNGKRKGGDTGAKSGAAMRSGGSMVDTKTPVIELTPAKGVESQHPYNLESAMGTLADFTKLDMEKVRESLTRQFEGRDAAYMAERIGAQQVVVFVMVGGGMMGHVAAEQPADFDIDDFVGRLPYSRPAIRQAVKILRIMAEVAGFNPHELPGMPMIHASGVF